MLEADPRICIAPFNWLELRRESCSPCCPAFLRKQGSRTISTSLYNTWNSPFYCDLRCRVARQDFSLCHDFCPARVTFAAGGTGGQTLQLSKMSPAMRAAVLAAQQGNGRLPFGPRSIALCMDNTCNLHCLFCRAQPQYRTGAKEAAEHTVEILESAAKWLQMFRFDGSGEPLFSPFYPELFSRWRPPDGIEIEMLTNGFHFTEERLDDLGIDRLTTLWVGCDGCTATTYEQLRRGGCFAQLLLRLPLMAKWKRTGKLQNLWFVYVVNAINFREMGEFVEFANRYDACVAFSPVLGGGEKRRSLRIFDPLHACYDEFLAVLRDPRLVAENVELRGVLKLCWKQAHGAATSIVRMD